MVIKNKKRYKPLYKKFKNLRKNVQNRKKLLKFKKVKWQNLILYLNRQSSRRTKNYIVYDHNKSYIPKFVDKFKNKYRNNLHVKQRFSLFYGEILNNILKKSIKQSAKKNLLNPNFFLIEKFEQQLCVILYRAYFTSSIRESKQLIIHNNVYVNKQVMKNSSYKVKKGDLIEIKHKCHSLVEYNIKTIKFWPLPPKYLQINYKIFKILLIDDIKFINFSTHFPFWLDLNLITKQYKNI